MGGGQQIKSWHYGGGQQIKSWYYGEIKSWDDSTKNSLSIIMFVWFYLLVKINDVVWSFYTMILLIKILT